ncbi:hypothetical protein NBRC111894_1337 [Sporolactobacillus inulinus]|uniref:Uncharacterized protein n=1 Tax=Sporolactobacillus inulinus TaxID=2078 RepID=A0A4Y1ZA25_9BACL|nr:hypothetical protein NBRC111894_1337 [Sporolactobacillus inulinus]
MIVQVRMMSFNLGNSGSSYSYQHSARNEAGCFFSVNELRHEFFYRTRNPDSSSRKYVLTFSLHNLFYVIIVEKRIFSTNPSYCSRTSRFFFPANALFNNKMAIGTSYSSMNDSSMND